MATGRLERGTATALFLTRRNGYGGSRGFGVVGDAQSGARALPVPTPARLRRRAGGARVLPDSSRASSTCRYSSTTTYSTLAESNRIAIVPVVPNRGVITDRNGVVLAQSYSAYTLELTPSRIEDLEATIDELAEIVDVQPRDRKRFRKLLDESKNFESLPLRTRLSDEEVARFAVNRYRFPGVEIKARLFRQYPYGEIASHVVGYIGRINDHDVERIAEVGRRGELQGLRLHRQGRRRTLLRARTARHHGLGAGRGRCRRPRGAHAVAHAAVVRATTCACRSTSSCRRPPRPRSATGAARWSRSTPRPATSSRSCRSPASTPTSSSTASTPRTGRRSTIRPTIRCSTGRCAARIRRARRSSRSWRSPR